MERNKKADREKLSPHVLEEKYTLTRENETGFVNFLYMCAACYTETWAVSWRNKQ